MAVLNLRNRTIDVYDSLQGTYDELTRRALESFIGRLPAYLERIGYYDHVESPRVLEFGINFIQDVPIQSGPLGDCGVWAPSGGVTDWYQSQGYREPDSLIDNTRWTAVEVKDGIIASAWNLVHRSLTFAEFSSLSGIVPSTADIKDYVELADGKNIEAGTII
ncbi:putative Ulp1 protease family, C-terminal catalytic domain-containing protein [Tanacetum coccineum]